MYLTATLQRGLIIAGLTVLAVVCVVALTHPTKAPAGANYVNPAASLAQAPLNAYGNPEPVAPPQYRNAPVVYAPSPFGSDYVNLPQPAPAAMESPAERQTRYVRHYYWRHGRRVVVVEKRPFSHSVAIVGGSAAGGAAIGALAGGGEGAAIGALAGGAGGFVYDRLTHKKKVVAEK
jgi:hypothetical protein